MRLTHVVIISVTNECLLCTLRGIGFQFMALLIEVVGMCAESPAVGLVWE